MDRTSGLERLSPEQLVGMSIAKGGHEDRSAELCSMELVAYLAGEPHSDSPACTSPVIAAFIRSWNDAIPDDETRTRLLKPILPRLIGTVGSPAVEQRRADLAFDWCVRVSTPAWLDLAGLKDEANALRSLRPLLDRSAVLAAQAALDRARERADAAWAAARDAAWAAARAAASDAARDAARTAARDAARDAALAAAWAAALAATWDAAWAAARVAAWTAARDAATNKLKPTVEQLQISALDVLAQMIAVSEADL